MSRLKKVAKATQALREIIGAELDDSNQGCCPMGDALREVAEIEAAIDALDEGYVDPAVCKQCQLVAPLTKALMKKPAIDEGWTDAVPTVPGWYWWRNKGCDCGCEEIRFIAHYTEDNSLRDVVAERERKEGLVRYIGGQWSGPITPPKPEGE